MSILDLFYTLFIWPIRGMIEFLFVFFNRTFYDAGLGIIFLSLVVNILLLPIYTVADRWQQEERLLQKKMKQKLADIRAVFAGDERQMLINTYYRQMGYSPVSALKSSAGLLLQIPFFLAAYQFLSHTPSLVGESFWILKNLGETDQLLHLGNLTINTMPFIMTAVNLASAMVYTKGLEKRDKIQLFGMSLLFLILLYRAPSGLVLYWTCNNIFSLGKNTACALLKHPARALQMVSALFGIVLIAGALSGYFDIDRYVYLFAGAGACLILVPFGWKALLRFMETRSLPMKDYRILYFSSVALFCLLLGLLIPGQVVSGSVADFDKPWQVIFQTFTQSVAFFLLIPFLVWSFAGNPVRKLLALGLGMLVFSALICLFALSSSYGAMTTNFKIEDTQMILRAFPFWVNIAAALGSIAVPGLFFILRKQRLLAFLYSATAGAVVILAVITMIPMNKEIQELAKLKDTREVSQDIFTFTRQGKNTFIMFLDRAVGVAMYTALEQMPELAEGFDGFTWYPNTISFGSATITGVPALMGGYDYIPSKINERETVLLKDKVNEAITMLPKIFGEAGYRVSITDPSMTNLQLIPDISVFKDFKNVTAQNLDGRLNKRFLDEFPQQAERLIDSFDFDILFRYSLFRIALPALRYGIYYKGFWWRDGASNAYGRGLTEYSSLYYLGDLCSVDDEMDTLNIFMNESTHEPGAYTADLRLVPGPIHFSQEEIDLFGSEDYAAYMYTYMTVMKAVVRWLHRVKELGVYDNTRIIIVADHGSGFDTGWFENPGVISNNPLLMVKQYEARGTLQASLEFMTIADVPSLVTADMDNPVNPYLGTPISLASKDQPLIVVNEVSFQPRRHGPYHFNISGTRELLAKDIFKAASWGPWQNPAKE